MSPESNSNNSGLCLQQTSETSTVPPSEQTPTTTPTTEFTGEMNVEEGRRQREH
jgi:hypothetical protein